MAWALGMQGARVVLIARSQAALEITVAEFAADGITAHAVSADLGDSAQRLDSINHAIAPFGAPDILVNCAGNNIRKALPDLTDADIRATLALNLEAPLTLIRAGCTRNYICESYSFRPESFRLMSYKAKNS